MSMYALGNETRVPENPGNPPIFKPVNPGLCTLKNPGLTGFVLATFGCQHYTPRTEERAEIYFIRTFGAFCAVCSYYRKRQQLTKDN